jgi:hypothetical protein
MTQPAVAAGRPDKREAVVTMYSNLGQARERQQALLSRAAEQRSAHQFRKLGRARRGAERADRQLSRSWCEAERLRAEFVRIAADQWR